MPERTLEGRVALVTGGASGIGRATAKLLAQRGARVCVADIEASGAEAVAKEIEEAGGEALPLCADVCVPEHNERIVAQSVSHFGGLHVAHLNAGIAEASSVLDGDIEVWDRVIEVNLRGVYLGMRAVAAVMTEAGAGSIIATASVAGLRGGRNMASYYASKHGVVGLVKAAALELAAHGVRVNAVCPGVIDTPILGVAHGVAEFVEGPLAKIHPMGRVGAPEEVAELVAFLASDASAFTTGATYPVDGGLCAGFALGANEDDGGGESVFQALGEQK